MRTLGIDLAAQPKNTSACVLVWEDGRGSDGGTAPCLGVDDDRVEELLGRANHAAIDAPFGWPDAFRQAVEGWTSEGRWSERDRDRLRFRETDKREHLGRVPLSVSSDRIAITAMRCALILARRHQGEPLDRVNGPVIEAYPAAALGAWKIETKGYKNPEAGVARRDAITRELRERVALDLSANTLAECVKTDHALDALVCSLVARAHAVGLVKPVPADVDRQQIAREGWIHVPTPESLERLGAGRVD